MIKNSVETLENKKIELQELNRLWSNVQELELNEKTKKKIQIEILNKIAKCEESILKFQQTK